MPKSIDVTALTSRTVPQLNAVRLLLPNGTPALRLLHYARKSAFLAPLRLPCRTAIRQLSALFDQQGIGRWQGFPSPNHTAPQPTRLFDSEGVTALPHL